EVLPVGEGGLIFGTEGFAPIGEGGAKLRFGLGVFPAGAEHDSIASASFVGGGGIWPSGALEHGEDGFVFLLGLGVLAENEEIASEFEANVQDLGIVGAAGSFFELEDGAV